MPTKTTGKTATRKPATHKPAKPAIAREPAVSKTKVPLKKAEPQKKTVPAPAGHSTKAKRQVAPKTPATPASAKAAASVSLIDRAKAHKELKDGQIKATTTVLPPISKILPKPEPPVPAKIEGTTPESPIPVKM